MPGRIRETNEAGTIKAKKGKDRMDQAKRGEGRKLEEENK